jgi:hypothetical protein
MRLRWIRDILNPMVLLALVPGVGPRSPSPKVKCDGLDGGDWSWAGLEKETKLKGALV